MRLELRFNTWHAIHDIPAAVRDALGKGRRFVASLKTDNKRVAERRGALFEVKWKGEIEAARSGSRDQIEKDAAYWRNALAEARASGDKEGEELVLDFIGFETEARLAKAARANGTYDTHELPDDPEAMRFAKVAKGELVRFTEHLEAWLLTTGNGPKSNDQKKSTVNRFAKKHPYVQDVSRKAVQKWVNELAIEGGKKPDTLNRFLSELRGYWSYLISLEVAHEDARPFDRLTIPKAAREAARKGKRKPFEPEQVVALVAGAAKRNKPDLADLIRLGMWTGVRIEALCALKIEQINLEAGWFEVLEDKTDAGARKVPIHSKLKPVIARLIGNRESGYLLPNLGFNKYGDRSGAIGHAFGRLKTALGYGDAHVFHSIRRTVITILENASVPENVTMDIVGHEKPSITYGTYSGGNSIAVMQKAIEKLKYPREMLD